jgi:hypothetical protein
LESHTNVRGADVVAFCAAKSLDAMKPIIMQTTISKPRIQILLIELEAIMMVLLW